MSSSEIPLEPRVLEELREIHQVGEEWEPRFVADRRIAAEQAEAYEKMGFEVEVYPHPDDVPPGRMPADNDRCVIYTRAPEDADRREEGLVDDSLL